MAKKRQTRESQRGESRCDTHPKVDEVAELELKDQHTILRQPDLSPAASWYSKHAPSPAIKGWDTNSWEKQLHMEQILHKQGVNLQIKDQESYTMRDFCSSSNEWPTSEKKLSVKKQRGQRKAVLQAPPHVLVTRQSMPEMNSRPKNSSRLAVSRAFQLNQQVQTGSGLGGGGSTVHGHDAFKSVTKHQQSDDQRESAA